MSALRPLLAAASLAALTACATAPTPEPYVRPESPAPTPIAGYDWHLNMSGGEAGLAYGVAESDDLKIGLDCNRASGRLELVTLADKGAKPEIVVESGGDTERFSAASEPSQLNDGVILTASASTAEPVFQRFRRVGWLAQWRDGEREAYAPQPGSTPNIERFFAFCG